MTSRKNRFLVYLLAALLGVIAVRVVQHLRGEPDGSTAVTTTAATAASDDEEGDDNPFPENVPAHDAFDAFMEKLDADPKFKAIADGTQAANAYDKGFGLTQDGLSRLSDAQLEQRLVLMSKVVTSMPDADCRTTSRPTVDAADKQRILNDAIGRLDRKDAAEWFDVSFAAARAVLDKAPVIASDHATVTAALERIVRQVPQQDRQRFLNAIRTPAAAEPADTCWATRTLYQTAVKLDEPYRAALARGLVETAG
ncbi:hypothetical protein [Burkholderia plantarii]|uniref:Uncharacterized protein n=1 Tax=Burkholderia plantarii TaxID=41899 RepID=A0A0B6S911_BURPL|nr:hypothetical protein [Burkholderia plantarii]AJK49770.1 hypothetical protein BGL_2c17030 [Burkholderia plantarii]